MRRTDQISGLGLLVFAIWFAVTARQHPYWTPNGPGSGFLPLWLGVTMAGLGAMLVVRATRQTDPGEGWLPRGRALARLAVVIAGTAVFIAAMPVVGMTLGTAVFLVVLLKFLEGHGWGVTLGVAIATAGLNWLVFAHWLRVPFPVSVLGF